MRTKSILIYLFVAIILLTESLLCKTKNLNVGVFDGYGGAQTCVWEAYQALRLERTINP